MIQNICTVLFLVFLEGMLSFDNALVLAVIARHLPESQRKKALTYGMWGAYLFRFLSLTVLTYIMQAAWVKVAGGLYLLYLAGQHFLGQGDADDTPTTTAKAFWRTILTIELADIAFSTDSILASIAVSDRLWVVVTGGILGITMMRLAAILFIRLIELFPNLERTAYLLVSTVGLKLLIESFHFQGVDFSSSSHPAFWALWGTMVVCVMTGFIPQKQAVVNT